MHGSFLAPSVPHFVPWIKTSHGFALARHWMDLGPRDLLGVQGPTVAATSAPRIPGSS